MFLVKISIALFSLYSAYNIFSGSTSVKMPEGIVFQALPFVFVLVAMVLFHDVFFGKKKTVRRRAVKIN